MAAPGRGVSFQEVVVLPAAYEDSRARLYVGDCRTILSELPAESVQCCVTSPPYWGLRDYGVAGQLGLEATPDEYAANLVAVFREVRRVLREDGVLWLNLGDSYVGAGYSNHRGTNGAQREQGGKQTHTARSLPGLKPKDLVGIPWMVAFALRADGWWLRSDVIWSKPNPMPESVTDRPTKAHEYVFLLTKSDRYFYDADAVKELAAGPPKACGPKNDASRNDGARTGIVRGDGLTRNARTVWTITPKPFKGAHFATFPPELAQRCILAGSKPSDLVLDPFNGAGTTGMVAMQHGRGYVGVELNPGYARLSVDRWGSHAAQFPLLKAAP